jgi:hypothetical protein
MPDIDDALSAYKTGDLSRQQLVDIATASSAGYGNQDQIEVDFAVGVLILLERGDL